MTEPIQLDKDDAAAPPADAELPAGFLIGGKYAVKRRLGVGATGAVYEGEHTGIGHRVAIKVVHRSLSAREDIIARFQREAKICGTIRDRHVGQVYDVGVLEDGAPYMVMELHEGGSLADLLDENKLSIAAIVDIARQLLAGLAAAHRANAVHRDVKPDNIMLVRENNGATVVKLVDFGISKNVQADISERNVTREGTVVGSVDYMPPEQLRGDEADARADIYAVGVVIYEALTGRTPFDAPNITELVVAVMRDPVTPPSTLRPECPPELEKVVQKAMSRKREQRYSNADEMSQALADVQLNAQLATDAGLGKLRESIPVPRGAGGVTLTRRRETPATGASLPERVATAELQLPRTSNRGLWIGLVVCALGGVALWLVASGDSTPERPTSQLKPAPQKIETQPPAEAVVEVQPQAPEPVIEPPVEMPVVDVPVVASHPQDNAAHKTDRTHNIAANSGTQPTRDTRPPPVRIEPAPVESQDTQAMLKEANAAFVLGQMPRARGLYQKVVTLSPKQADAWRGLGMVSSRMGQRSDAVRALQRYLELRPTAPDAARIHEQLDKLK